MVHRSLAAVIAAVVLLAAAACCCCGGGFDWPQVMDPTAGGSIATLVATMLPTAGPISPPTPVPNIVLTREPAGDAGRETEELLEMAEVPVRDLHELAIRLQGVPADTPRTVNPEGSPDYELGARRLFNVSNVDTDEQFDIYAT
ncbi:MAG: hypothetical protein GXY36_01460, partial [Chloroflexi bacterium]|nr:hypothetical protein [Chloroflexota bacterium]